MNTALIISIGGLIIFAIHDMTQPKLPHWIGEAGRLMFWVGLLAFLLK